MTEHKTVGMIRTNRFSQAIRLFPSGSLRRVEVYRSRRTATTRDIYKNWILEDVDEIHTYNVNWNYWEKGTRFELDKVIKLIMERDLGEMTMEEVEFEFQDPQIISAFADELDGEAAERFPMDTKLYATFRNNFSPEVRKDPYVQALNAAFIRRWRLRYGVLDLHRLETERAKKYGEKEQIPVFDWPEIARLVLGNLEAGGWPHEEREATVNGQLCHPKPFALRRYEAASRKGWALIGTEEI